MKKQKGSFSVEAAYIMPIVLLCLFFPIWIGIDMHQEVRRLAQMQQQEKIVDVISEMYKKEYIKGLLGEIDGD